MGEAYRGMEEKGLKNSYKILIGKSEWKRPLRIILKWFLIRCEHVD
jgi:hypothetical protein